MEETFAISEFIAIGTGQIVRKQGLADTIAPLADPKVAGRVATAAAAPPVPVFGVMARRSGKTSDCRPCSPLDFPPDQQAVQACRLARHPALPGQRAGRARTGDRYQRCRAAQPV